MAHFLYDSCTNASRRCRLYDFGETSSSAGVGRDPGFALEDIERRWRDRSGGRASRVPLGPFERANHSHLRIDESEIESVARLEGSRRSLRVRSALRDRSPVQPESLAMPADDGFGLNDDQDLFPSRPDLRQQDPEAPIGRSDPGSAPSLGECGELLTKGEFDDRLPTSASKEGRNTAEEDRCEFEQMPHSDAYSARRHRSIRD